VDLTFDIDHFINYLILVPMCSMDVSTCEMALGGITVVG